MVAIGNAYSPSQQLFLVNNMHAYVYDRGVQIICMHVYVIIIQTS